MSENPFELDLDELESAEDFLEFFGVEYEPSVVHVNRLHILQRFHQYIEEIDGLPRGETAQYELYAGLLRGAYEDFVHSSALEEKVFRVFQMHEPRSVSIPVTELLGR